MSITSLTVTLFHKPSPGITESNCQTSVPSPQCTSIVTYVEERRSSSGIRRELGGVYLGTDTATSKCVLVARIPALPIVPHLVNHLYNMHVSPFSVESLVKHTA